MDKKENLDGKIHTISKLIKNIGQAGIKKFTDEILHSKHRTAGANSIFKADALYQWAKILQANKIETFDDFRRADWDKLDVELKKVQGQDEAALKYLFMLENTCKPDRHLLWFLVNAMGHTVAQNEPHKPLYCFSHKD